MKVNCLEKDLKNLQEQNIGLQEKVNQLQVQLSNVASRIETIEKSSGNRPIQMYMYGDSTAPQERMNLSEVPPNLSSEDEDYMGMYSPAKSPSTYMSNMYPTPSHPRPFPSTDLLPSQANKSYTNEASTSQQYPQLPPTLPYHTPAFPYHTPPLPYHAPPLPYKSPPELPSSQVHPGQQLTPQGNTKCHPIKPKKNANTLPSAAIIKESLIPPTQACTKYYKLLKISKAPTLATKLARDSFFGEDVLRWCTVMSCREQPGPPIQELNELKQAVFEKFLQYWPNPVEFEDLWAQCVDAIGQLCKRLRKSSGQWHACTVHQWRIQGGARGAGAPPLAWSKNFFGLVVVVYTW